MPPTRAQSSAIVPTGSKDVWHDGPTRRRRQGGTRPSTERALVLRNGKEGINGSGEVTIFTRLFGREKLELLAEDLMKDTSQALGVKINLEKCEKIAESQFNYHSDNILDMQDPNLFIDRARVEIRARNTTRGVRFKDATWVAETIAAMIHNEYMLTSSWKIVYDYVRDLRGIDLIDTKIRAQLSSDEWFRMRYLALYDIVDNLTSLYHARLSLLATTSPHFARYFTQNAHHAKAESKYAFEWSQLKALQKSYLDSIVVELCLPNSRFPDNILHLLLRDAIDEASHKEQSVFPQVLWDAIGDLSVTVELREMLDSVLLGPEGEKWKKNMGKLDHPREYEDWLDAQAIPSHMKLYVSNWKDVIYPLKKTRSRPILDEMWLYININYQVFTGKDINTLWNLGEIHERTPQWHAFKSCDRNVRAITNGDGSDSENSMPPLKTATNSSEVETDCDDESDDDENVDNEEEEGEDEDEDDEEDEEDDEEDEDEEDEDYDEEDEVLFREFEREAMDAASTIPDFYNPNAPAPELDELAEEQKGNPFIKLLSALRGRMFSGDAALKSDKRAQPSRPFPNGKPPAAGKAPPRPRPAPKSKKATVEDVEDEEAGGLPSVSKKKKKKKPKKEERKRKRKPAAGSAENEADTFTEPRPATTIIPTSPEPKKKETSKPKSKPAPRSASIASTIKAMPFGGSTVTLASGPSVAQSAHKYIQEEGISEKARPKSRPAFGALASIQSGGREFFAKWEKDKEGDKEEKANRHSFFTTLTEKTKFYMHQLLNTDKKESAPLKWENFVKVMTEMGFTVNPSTAGSSVRFDPPNPKDHPITFHKPHPDSTLYPVMLKKFGARLKRNYGWSEEDFYRRVI